MVSLPAEYRDIEIHKFADAFEYTYATVIYLKSRENNSFTGWITSLVIAKTRETPLKIVSQS